MLIFRSGSGSDQSPTNKAGPTHRIAHSEVKLSFVIIIVCSRIRILLEEPMCFWSGSKSNFTALILRTWNPFLRIPLSCLILQVCPEEENWPRFQFPVLKLGINGTLQIVNVKDIFSIQSRVKSEDVRSQQSSSSSPFRKPPVGEHLSLKSLWWIN